MTPPLATPGARAPLRLAACASLCRAACAPCLDQGPRTFCFSNQDRKQYCRPVPCGMRSRVPSACAHCDAALLPPVPCGMRTCDAAPLVTAVTAAPVPCCLQGEKLHRVTPPHCSPLPCALPLARREAAPYDAAPLVAAAPRFAALRCCCPAPCCMLSL